MLKLIPLGGLGEIGLNMMVVEYDDVMFIIDAGLMFPEDYMLGVDIVIPAMDYLRENKNKIHAIIIRFTVRPLPWGLSETNWWNLNSTPMWISTWSVPAKPCPLIRLQSSSSG
ncbi:MAG: hypothetical protein LC660_18760 [Desulfobacteraceae bacterium]|nr:hypothetical protein [Desulfobacteraceae bacterium]